MRLRDIQHILKTELAALEPATLEPQNSPMGAARSFHRRRLEVALHALRQVEPFQSAADKALGHAALREPGEPTLVVESVFADFLNNYLRPLAQRGRDLLAAIDSILPNENLLSFAFRLPDGEWDLKALRDEVDELKLIFDEPLARLMGERTTVEALDRGSLLVELSVALPASLSIVSLLCKAAKAIMDTRNQYRVQELQYDSIKLDVRYKAAIVEANVQALAQVSRQLAEGVVSRAGKPGDNEATNVVALALDKLTGQFERNARVLLAQNAPEEAKQLMPKVDGPPLLPELVIKELLAVNPGSNNGETRPSESEDAGNGGVDGAGPA